MKPHLICLLLLLALPGTCVATDLRINAAEIVGWGIFEASSTERRTGFSRSALPADDVTGVRFTEFTNEIPAELGINFGFQYVVNTTPRGQELQVTKVIRFPGDGLHSPGGRVYKESREQRPILIGQKTFYGYGFDEPWELVPGEWVFEIWHKKAMLIRKTFTVVEPTEVVDDR